MSGTIQVSGIGSFCQRTDTYIVDEEVSYFHNVPTSNRAFVGRTEELAELEQKLMINQECKKISIVGLGGTGKTQVALQFVHNVKKKWPDWSIFWLSAVSMESFEKGCAELVKALHIPQTSEKDDPKELVKRHLSTTDGRSWLLVLDNADIYDLMFGEDSEAGIVHFQPENEGSVIVYTTRTREVAVSLTQRDILHLGPMSETDAVDFLEKSLDKKELLRASKDTTTDLLRALAYLPLAISQAVAYLNINQTSIARYLELLQQTEEETIRLMSKEFHDNTRHKGAANAVAATWVVSFQQLREHNVGATNLLEFMSCIEWRAISLSSIIL